MELQGSEYQAGSDGINHGSESIGAAYITQSDNPIDAKLFAGTHNTSSGVHQCGGKRKTKKRNRNMKKRNRNKKNKTKKRSKTNKRKNRRKSKR
uniref:Uncharacterized protein n=1 Tax=viral metagenome TaxID=1070528 RepID=A0A6C0KN69_9ZZZZ